MLAQRWEPEFPIDALVEHPANPRRGNVDVIEASIEAHGFYGAVLMQASTQRVIAGNHRLRAARRTGATTLPVLVLDVDDDEAARIMLVDNRSNDLASYDDEALAAVLRALDGDRGFVGTGYEPADLARLLDAIEPALLDEVRPLDQSQSRSCPWCGAHWHDTPDGPALDE